VAKAGEEHFRKAGAAAGFAAFDVAHWNKIDGRNDWRDFDTACLATLPYATNSLDLSTYMAVRDAELDDDALNAPPDEVRLVRENRVAAQLAQAIGRIRLRTMTKSDGTCEPCDVFLRLPDWRRWVDADRVLAAVLSTLPGAQVAPWPAATRKKLKPPATALPDVVERLLALSAGAAVTAKALGATHGTLQRVLEAATKKGDPVCRALAERGVRLVRGASAPGLRGRTSPRLLPTV
jgi:hypothetical protein